MSFIETWLPAGIVGASLYATNRFYMLSPPSNMFPVGAAVAVAFSSSFAAMFENLPDGLIATIGTGGAVAGTAGAVSMVGMNWLWNTSLYQRTGYALAGFAVGAAAYLAARSIGSLIQKKVIDK